MEAGDMRIFLGAMLLALSIAPFVVPASADHGCEGAVTDVGGVLYIVDRGNGVDWIYVESNGEAGLQTGGTGPLNQPPFLTQQDTCAHANPDTLVY